MIRVSITGILSFLGAALVVAGLFAAVPAPAVEPICRGSGSLEAPCLQWIVEMELATNGQSTFEKLIDWCGTDQLCRLQVLDARAAGDTHTEMAMCRMWTPEFLLPCEQNVRARHPQLSLR